MKFVGLSVGGGMKFRVGHSDRPESSDRRHQRLFFYRVNAILTRIYKDRTLRPRSTKGGCDQHSRKDEAAQRVHIGANGNRDRFSGHGGTLRQIGGKSDCLAVMSGTR